ncbi:MAG: YggU family protein [Verrucomicrobia bacterium]|nr:YggU family protein [Verrucomicrobiota bacterium]
MSHPPYLRALPDGVFLSVKVQPRASRNQIGGLHGDELKVAVTAPPVDSAANQAVVEFLAETLGLPRRSVTLVRGQTSRHKVFCLDGITAEQVASKLTS